MKKMTFLLFLSLLLTQSLTALADTPEGDDGGEEEVARVN